MKMKSKTKKFAAGGPSDEERYGKVGAEIRRLDPEAYKNRPRSAEGNLQLLKELRAKASQSSSPRAADSDDYKINRPKVASSGDSAPKQPEAAKPAATPAPKAEAPKAKATKPDETDTITRQTIPPKAWQGARDIAAGFKSFQEAGARDAAEKAARNKRISEVGLGNYLRESGARDTEEKAARLQRIGESMRSIGLKSGGSVYRRAADGITQRGKTKGTEVRMARGGSVSSASKRADGCAMKGKTKGRFV